MTRRLDSQGDRLVNWTRYQADLEEFRRNPPPDDGSLQWLIRSRKAARPAVDTGLRLWTEGS